MKGIKTKMFYKINPNKLYHVASSSIIYSYGQNKASNVELILQYQVYSIDKTVCRLLSYSYLFF